LSARPLAEVALFTDDVEALKRFYRDVAGAEPVTEWPGGAIFDFGEAKLLVHERAEATEGGPSNEDHFAVGVPDLDAAFTELRSRGHAVHVEPREYEWGRSAYLLDPDGRIVELLQT
jgi:catechol 2,3-dioxygenase-like lactoylglutathione lyase family enzyme